MCNAKDLRDFDSLFELMDYFSTEEVCENYLAKVRWNGSPECVYCGHDNVYVMNVKGRGKRFKCAKCRKQASVRVGTIFEESKISLRKWFVAIYLITAHKKGISSHQLAKDIKVTQKTSFFMLHRVREMFKPETEKFTSEVEIDEHYYGGKERNRHASKRTPNTQGRSTKTKTPILGILERDGKVYALPVADTKAKTIIPIIKERVQDGTKVYTDEWVSYRTLGSYYNHEFVHHGAEEFVRGEVHTNSIESFWALLKRGLTGIYHHVSDEHLNRYVNEFTFRFNNRILTDGSKFDATLANCKGRLDYKTLTKK